MSYFKIGFKVLPSLLGFSFIENNLGSIFVSKNLNNSISIKTFKVEAYIYNNSSKKTKLN